MIAEPLLTRLPPAAVYEATRLAFPDELAPWLDSAQAGGPRGTYSIIPIGKTRMLWADNLGVWQMDRADTQPKLIADTPLAALKALDDTLQRNGHPNRTGLPFAGGLTGYLSYDLCSHTDAIPLPADERLPMPLMHWTLWDAALVHNHTDNTWHYASSQNHTANAQQHLQRIYHALPQVETPQNTQAEVPSVGPLKSNFTQAAFCAAVEQTRGYIAKGDIYQLNLSQQFHCHWRGDPLALYKRLRQASPAPYAAFMPIGSATLLSSSPELFLRVREGRIETRPIKGTRPRGTTAQEDRANSQALQTSEKERAELLMIADLERNDLGRICQPGSIRTTELYTLETYPQVFHQVAHIEGQLQQSLSTGDILRATFPGGSITGAPKIRAMQLISALEGTRRGPYCGSIGWIGYDGTLELNIAIRTLLHHHETIVFHAGGGIVWDSQPEMEYRETWHKAAGMLTALGINKDNAQCSTAS